MKDVKEINNYSTNIENFCNCVLDVDSLLSNKRIEANLTQMQLAEKTNIKQSNLCRIEKNKSSPNVSTLKQICSGMDMLLKINFSPNPENYYYGRKKMNHIIPKVYYKQWAHTSCGNNNNLKLKLIDANGNITYKNLEKFNSIKNAFIIRFGDTFLPDVVKTKFIDVTKEYKFFYNDKEYFDIEVLSNNYYLFKDWIVINKKGKFDKHGFETKISQQSCYSIEIGLDIIFEKFYPAVVSVISELFNGKKFATNVIQLIIDYIIRVYLCFYLRSEAWNDLSKGLFDTIADIYIKNRKYPNVDKIRYKIHEDLKKEYLWMLLYEYETFTTSFDRFFKMLRYKNIRIYRNNTKISFATSKMPIINNGNNVFFVMSPEYLVEFVDDYVNQNRIYMYEIVKESFVEERNKDIMKKAKEIIICNK